MNPIGFRRKTFTAFTALTALTVFGVVAPITLTPTPIYAQAADGIERAERSQLVSLRLPKGTLRTTDKDNLEKFAAALQTAAETNHGSIGKIEVLVWTKEDSGNAKKEMPKLLKAAGYSYVTTASFDSEAGKVTPVASTLKNEKDGLVGMWIDTAEGISLLCWAEFKSGSGESSAEPGEETTTTETEATEAESPKSEAPAEREILPTALSAKPAQPVAAKPVVGGKVPADMLGSWSWTTISSVNYQNTTTGQLASPSGMSAKFTFLPNGRYKFFFYVTQRTYSLVTQATTNAEGTVEFRNDGTFILRPTSGHYNGNTGSRIIDRPMTAAERKPTTYYWEWRTEDGKRNLYMGPTKSSMSRFKNG